MYRRKCLLLASIGLFAFSAGNGSLSAGEGSSDLTIQVELGVPAGFSNPLLSNAMILKNIGEDQDRGPVVRMDRIPERFAMGVSIPEEKERWRFVVEPLPFVGGEPVETLVGSVAFPAGPGAAAVPGIIRIPCEKASYRSLEIVPDQALADSWEDRMPLRIFCYREGFQEPFEVISGRFPLVEGVLELQVIEGREFRIEGFPSSPFRHRQVLGRFPVGGGEEFRDRVEWTWTEPVGIPLTITIGGEVAALDDWTHASILFRNLDDGTRSNLLVPIRDGLAAPISLYQIERSSGVRLPIELFSVRFSSEDSDEVAVYRVGKPFRLDRESFDGDGEIHLNLIEQE